MSNTQYPLHAQYVRLIDADQAILNDLKNKSTPLIINDAYVPPINYERTDLPWTLGSKAQPWKNLYISNKNASELSPSRSEVIDVYTALANAVTEEDLETLKEELRTEIASLYATKAYVGTETERPATLERPGALKLASYVDLYGFKPNGIVTTDTIYVRLLPTERIKLIDGTLTDFYGWTSSPVLLNRENRRYEGTTFKVKQLKDLTPGTYSPEQDNIYVIVYNETTICVQEAVMRIVTPRDLAVYVNENGEAYTHANFATSSLAGIVRVDGTTITVNDEGVITALGGGGTSPGNIVAVLVDE